MKLTVLGNNGPYPKAGSACSGYLLQDADKKILIDCGNGTISRLQKICKLESLDAIILTHLHSDHISDIFVMKYAIGIKKMQGKFDKSIPVYTPNDDEYLIDNMNYNDAFNINFLTEDTKISIGNLEFSFSKTKHPVDTYSVSVTDQEKTFVYSSDTSYCEKLIDFANNADLFLCEAGVLEKDKTEDTPHLSAKEAGEISQKANVKRLLLTHFWPEYKLDWIMKEALENYNSILELSHEMKVYFI